MEKRTITTKEDARQYATDWQKYASEQNLSYGELAEWNAIFETLAIRYNVTEEYRENGII